MSAWDRWLARVLALAQMPEPAHLSFVWLMLEAAYVEAVSPEAMALRLQAVTAGGGCQNRA